MRNLFEIPSPATVMRPNPLLLRTGRQRRARSSLVLARRRTTRYLSRDGAGETPQRHREVEQACRITWRPTRTRARRLRRAAGGAARVGWLHVSPFEYFPCVARILLLPFTC